MLTDKDYNIAKKVVENFDLPSDIGCDQEDSVFNTDIIYDQLRDTIIGTCCVEYGISKVVIIPENENFVIKIPFGGMWYSEEIYNDETEEYEYTDDPCFDTFENADAPDESDYCWDELLRIEEANDAGFGKLFPQTDFLLEVNGKRFYIQEKVQTSREFTPQVSEDSRTRAKAMDYDYNYGSIDWRAAIIEEYGEDFWRNFCDWASANANPMLYDMHSGNYGYLNGKPIILDASGFDSQKGDIQMGLENGIILHTKYPVETPIPSDLFQRMMPTFDGNEYCYNICFWRKCWNVRSDIIVALGCDHDNGSRDFLDVGDVKAIWHVVNHLNKKKRWNESASIWTYKEIRDQLDRDLLALEWLIYVMRQLNPDYYHVEFYDSY